MTTDSPNSPATTATVVPIKRSLHPPVTYRDKSYDTNCPEFIRRNEHGEFLYWEPEHGYLLASVYRPPATVEMRHGRQVWIDGDPHYRIGLLMPVGEALL